MCAWKPRNCLSADAVFRNTGLERAGPLQKDLDWFRSEGHNIPPPGNAGNEYSDYLVKLAKEDPPAFICHYYNVYFAHTAGGRFIGKKVGDVVFKLGIVDNARCASGASTAQ